MPVLVLFFLQVALYAAVPFYLASLRNPVRVAAFYIYIGILLILGGLLGGVYSLPILPAVNVSGGNLAYGALLMSTVLLVIIERDVASVRRVIQLVILVNIFKLFLFGLLSLSLNNEIVINPYSTSAAVFVLSLPITVLGGTLTILELVLLLFIFEFIKQRISNVTIVSSLYTIFFVLVLCLDGVLFPIMASTFNPRLVAIVLGGVTGKMLMGLLYSIPMLIFLIVYRRSLTEFVEKPLTLTEMLRAPQERLVEEIQRQRLSLELGEEQLRIYAERLEIAAAAAGLGIWDLDLEQNVMVWDQRSFEMFGVPPTNSKITAADWEARVHPDDLAGAHQNYAEALAGKHDYHAQYRILLPDGQLRYIESYAKVRWSATGVPYRMIGVNTDITHRKQLAIDNERLTAQFYHAQRLESIGRLAGGIAHDFNNVLVPISSFAELGLLKMEAETKPHTYFKRIKEAADRAAGLTRQILAFSRNQALEMKSSDLNEIVTNFQHMVQRLIGEDINLQLDLTPDLPAITADPGQVEQVLMNLVVNARDAMPNGGTLTISTSQVLLKDEVVLTNSATISGLYMVMAVRDSGMGMDEATKQRVFEPFFTTKPQGKGTGLGLSTVFGIVKQHQGHIQIESEVGKGTIFKIFLPVALETPLELADVAVDGV